MEPWVVGILTASCQMNTAHHGNLSFRHSLSPSMAAVIVALIEIFPDAILPNYTALVEESLL